MAELVLEEQRVGPVFGQVRGIAVAKAVHGQFSREVGVGPPLGEALVNSPGRDTLAPLGEPQGRAPGRLPMERAYLGQVLAEDPTAQGMTEATTRLRGGLPRMALPKRTWQVPKRPSSGAAGFGPKSATSSIAASRRRRPQA